VLRILAVGKSTSMERIEKFDKYSEICYNTASYKEGLSNIGEGKR